MLKLYDYFRSGAAYRTRIALNLKGLDYEQNSIHLTRDGGQQFFGEYAALNPQKLVPTLIDGDCVLIQSMAIMEYLEDAYPEPSLLPDGAQARARVRARQLLKGINEEAIGQVMYVIQQYASRLVSGLSFHPGHQPALPDDIADEIRELLRPGDIFVTRKEYVLTNYFLPGYWPHAALYMGDESDLIAMGIQDHENVKPRWQRLLALDPDEPKRVFEALKDGAWIRSLKSPFSVDAVAVIRPNLSQEQVAEALARGLFHEGKSYDFDFDFTRSDRIVCTEVVFRTYEGIGDMKFKLTPRAGRMTLSAEDLLRMALKRENFEPVAVFAPSHKKGLISGERADELLEETMSED